MSVTSREIEVSTREELPCGDAHAVRYFIVNANADATEEDVKAQNGVPKKGDTWNGLVCADVKVSQVAPGKWKVECHYRSEQRRSQ